MTSLLPHEDESGLVPVQGERNADGWVTITARSHPFRVSRDVVMVRPGATLADMLYQAQPDAAFRRHATIFIEGHRIHRKYWTRIYPKAGTHVEINVLPSGGGGGGGKNILRTVALLAVVAASFALPPLVFGQAFLGRSPRGRGSQALL